MITVTLDRPWLIARLAQPMRVLSWAPIGAGYQVTASVLWREVRNADLSLNFDAESWFAQEMTRFPGAVGMMTSRDIGTYQEARSEVEGIAAHALATVGLTNGEAVGHRRDWGPRDFGTINILVATTAPLTEAAQLEALSIAVQARTAAVIAAGVDGPTGRVTGTGTDCLALACPIGDMPYAGLHTAVGEAIGAATRAAVAKGAEDWKRWFAAETAKAEA
ncbi:MAG: adenosylcobinamide amidohydrolase [Cypionkella sp.]|nr:adenosylcobinamide amidohydrolase [Cypionkella sp.]